VLKNQYPFCLGGISGRAESD